VGLESFKFMHEGFVRPKRNPAVKAASRDAYLEGQGINSAGFYTG